jgi:hypothetical protein
LKEVRFCKRGVHEWGPVAHESTHPLLQWESPRLVDNVLSLEDVVTGGSH